MVIQFFFVGPFGWVFRRLFLFEVIIIVIFFIVFCFFSFIVEGLNWRGISDIFFHILHFFLRKNVSFWVSCKFFLLHKLTPKAIEFRDSLKCKNDFIGALNFALIRPQRGNFYGNIKFLEATLSYLLADWQRILQLLGDSFLEINFQLPHLDRYFLRIQPVSQNFKMQLT